MKYLLSTVLILGTFSSANAQLKMMGKENFVLDRSISSELSMLKDLSGDEIEFLKRNRNAIKQLSTKETILSTGDNGLVTVSDHNTKTITLTNFNVSGDNIIELKSAQFGMGSYFVPLSTGSITSVENNEGGGYKIQVYSHDIQFLGDYVPFVEGYDRISTDTKDNLIFVGANSTKGGQPNIALLNDRGELLFKTTVSSKGSISKVLCSLGFLAVYCFEVTTRSHELFIYNTKGILVWKKPIEEMIQSWMFNESSLPYLIVGTQTKLLLMNANDGVMLGSIKLGDVYSEAGFSRIRNDNYIEISGMESLTDSPFSSILLTEPLNKNSYKNTLLLTISPQFKSNREHQIIKIGNSIEKPLLKKSANHFMVIKDNEIIRYGL